MSRLKQIGREYKRSYPGAYDEWTDEEVGQAVIDKDLNENDADGDVAMMTWSGAISNIARADTSLRDLMLADSGLVEKIQKTFDYYNPQVGVFSNWWRRLNGESRNKLLGVLTEEQQLLIKQAATLENEIREGKMKQVEFHLFIARNVAEFASLKYQSQFNKEAFGSGMTVGDYSDANKQERLTVLSIKQAQELAKIEIQKHEVKTKIDLDAKIQESNYILENTEKQQLNEQNMIARLKKQLQEAIIERDALKLRDLPEETKRELLEIEEKHIQNLKDQLNERYSRLV